MQFQYSPFILPLLVSALISGWIMIYSWQRGTAPGIGTLTVMAFAILEWSIGYALEIAGIGLETKVFWGKLQYIGITLVPVSWAAFAYYHTRQGVRSNWRNLAMLMLVPVITVLLAFTTEKHGLLWKTIDTQHVGSFSSLAVTYGIWFWIYAAYSYILLIAGTVMIVRWLGQSQGVYRRQASALIVAVLAPWLGNALYLSGFSPVPYLDLTPFAFTITLLALAWAIFASQLVNLSPIARDLIVNNMRDGLIVMDNNNYIVDVNPAAGRMIGIPLSQAIGKRFAEAFAPWPALVTHFQDAIDATGELVVGEGDIQKKYAAHISVLRDTQGIQIGRILTLRALVDGEMYGLEHRVRDVDTQPRVELEADTDSVDQKRSGPFGWILDFFNPPLKTDLIPPPNVNPKWYQVRERAFTSILRFAAVLGTTTLGIAPSFAQLQVRVPFAFIFILIWVLGIFRNFDYKKRTSVFLVLIYGLATVEMYNFGYSVASFTFFVTLVVMTTLLLDRNAGLLTLGISIVTIGTFGYFIATGIYLPINAHEGIPVPGTIQRALTSLMAFVASNAGLIAAISLLMDSLNKSWQLETQTRNLLQQERDLLDLRVKERTAELTEAHDSAIESGNQLRKYFMAIEQSGSTIVITDNQGNIEYANPRFEQTTGYTAEEAIGQNPRILRTDKHFDDYYSNLWKTISNGDVWTGEFLNRRKDGSLYWEAATIAPIVDQDGKVTNYVAIKDDITARRKAEEQLLRLSQAVEQSGNSITILDKSGRVEYVNSGFTKISGYSLDEALGKIPAELFSDKGTEIDFEQEPWWKAVSTGEIWQGEFLNNRKDGSQLWVVSTIAPVHNADGEIINYVEVSQDITNEKRLQEQLKESELRFRQIIESASDLIYRTNAQGEFTYVNPVGAHLLGLKETDVIGIHYLELVAPEARHRLKRFYDRQFLAEENNTYQEFPVNTQDGREIWIGQNVQLLKDEGKIIGFQAVARDVTKIRQAYEALAIARDQALEASKFKSQLLSRVSHELRTPLSGVMGYADLLNSGVYGQLTKDQEEATAFISESASYLAAMISDLLDEAQINSKNISLNIAPFNPKKLLENVQAHTTPLAHKKNLYLNVDLSPEIPELLMGDQKRLQQILINLLGNGVKFTQEGGVTVRVQASSNNRWILQVEDTGSGIPEDARGYIFEPFRQVNNAITRENRGSGLGLSIVKQLVELMGGTIQVDSEIGKGSTFTITLPILLPKEDNT